MQLLLLDPVRKMDKSVSLFTLLLLLPLPLPQPPPPPPPPLPSLFMSKHLALLVDK
jgi:hypothetical protein